MTSAQEQSQLLIVKSPGGSAGEALRFPFKKEGQYDEAEEWRLTFSLLAEEEELRSFFRPIRIKIQDWDPTNFNYIAEIVEDFNTSVTKYLYHCKQKDPQNYRPREKCSQTLMHHIMNIVYNRAIPDPTVLNKYEGWTPQVYGEFQPSLISEVLNRVKAKPSDNFIDLGSGVGQVVLQVAGEAGCGQCIGIEQMERPAELALELKKAFEDRMAWFGKKHSESVLIQGDFTDPQYLSYIREADVIVVNNYAFGAELNSRLKDIFLHNCKNGCRIASSLNLVKVQEDITFTGRKLQDLSSVLRVEKFVHNGQGVSWTSKPFEYYIHTYDQSLLYRYLKKKAGHAEPDSPVRKTRTSLRLSQEMEGADIPLESVPKLEMSRKALQDSLQHHLKAHQTQIKTKKEEIASINKKAHDLRTDCERVAQSKVQEACARFAPEQSNPNASALTLAVVAAIEYEKWYRARALLMSRLARLKMQQQGLQKLAFSNSPLWKNTRSLLESYDLPTDLVMKCMLDGSEENLSLIRDHLQENCEAKSKSCSEDSSDQPATKRAKLESVH